jgi:hypothetical protein
LIGHGHAWSLAWIPCVAFPLHGAAAGRTACRQLNVGCFQGSFEVAQLHKLKLTALDGMGMDELGSTGQ